LKAEGEEMGGKWSAVTCGQSYKKLRVESPYHADVEFAVKVDERLKAMMMPNHLKFLELVRPQGV